MTAAGCWSTLSSSGSRWTARSNPASTASRSGASSPDPARGGHRRASARPRPPTASPRRRSPRTPAGRTPALCAASTPGSPAGRSRTRPWPATSPSSTSRGELRRARRRRWPRRASGPASPARRVRPGNERARILAGYRRTAVERGRGQARPFGAADLTRRPRQLPPASSSRPRRRVRRGRPEARPPRRGDRGAALHGGAAAERGERPPVGRQSPSLPPATGCW